MKNEWCEVPALVFIAPHPVITLKQSEARFTVILH
jgi:hypothetical protein